MNEEYLWNRAGEADPEVAYLERVLGTLRYEPEASRLDLSNSTPKLVSGIRWRWAVGIAACAIITVAISWGWMHLATPASAWKLSWNGAAPQVVRSGQTIETGKHSAARLEADFIGEVRVDPQSRIRVRETTRDHQRLDLEHGTIHAFIWAPPREFIVHTPSAMTIDLGCQYTLHVGGDGVGILNVEMGWVAFQWKNLESFIPAGAACITRPGRGPGTPYFLDAPVGLRTATERFDESGDFGPLRALLTSARRRDALTLWHLLSRTEATERGEVFARFSQLVNVSSDVTREKILNGDPAALDAAWNALNLGDTSWWRGWKRRW